jgi:hypothetical protein
MQYVKTLFRVQPYVHGNPDTQSRSVDREEREGEDENVFEMNCLSLLTCDSLQRPIP